MSREEVTRMQDDPQRCVLERAVYDCPNCGHREYQRTGGTYLAEVTCENQPCHEESPKWPDTFPSTARLVGFFCPEHGWRLPPHLEQSPLPGEPHLRG